MSQTVDEDTLQVVVKIETDKITKFNGSAILIENVNVKDGRIVQVGQAQKGDLFVDDGTNTVRLPPGPDGFVLSFDSNEPTGIKWTDATQIQSTITEVIRNRLPVGTQGQVPTAAGVWDVLNLNNSNGTGGTSIVFDGTITNQIILESPGVYFVNASAPAFACDDHQCRLFNVTDNQIELFGSVERANTGQMTNRSFLYGVLQFTGTTYRILEYQHRALSNNGQAAFGRANGFDNEIYAIIQFFKIG